MALAPSNYLRTFPHQQVNALIPEGQCGMRINEFMITNFKGIKQCSLDLSHKDPRAISLIGLNESGKTTILEALNYFVAADKDIQKLYGNEDFTINATAFVPKAKKLNFNGTVSIAATVGLEQADIKAVQAAFANVGYVAVNPTTIGEITIQQQFKFKNSDFIDSGRTWTPIFKVRKTNGTKVSMVGASHPCWSAYYETLTARIPQICYFPTFLFDFPDKIYIEDHTDEDPVNSYYRTLVQDVLDSLDQGLSLQTHVIDRIKGTDGQLSWVDFSNSDAREQVNHLFSRVSAKITAVVLASWKRVFKSDIGAARVEIEYSIDPTNDLVILRLYMIDGDERYSIGDRSLGFRWFFCFWLFTYFRTLRSGDHGVVFLIDEPASNLHARAQEEILQNLEKLAIGGNVVVYSTHSHYLVNPRWLDRAYIVSNGSSTQPDVKDEFTYNIESDIKAVPYKVFAGSHPNQRNFYLPVLDALDIDLPSSRLRSLL